jgi:hypothetical protein
VGHPSGRFGGCDARAWELRLEFADGLIGDIDVLDRMRGRVFAARTHFGFAMAWVDAELGTVVWSGGADMAPDSLHDRVRTGRWPDHDLTR